MSDVPVPVKNKPVPVNIATLSEVVEGLRRPDRHAQLLSLLGSEAAVERFVTVAVQSVASNNQLLSQVTPASLIDAIKEAAVLDLEPTGLLGEAWIVKHGQIAVLRIGWRGFLKMIRREPDTKMIDTQIVYENDFFDIQLGTTPNISHVPTLDKDRGAYKGAYAWARTTRDELYIEWMTTADIEAVRQTSQMKGAGAWKDWWSEMARKSVVRRLAKRLPLHTVSRQAVALDEAADADEADGTAAPVRVQRARTLELLAAGTGASHEAEATEGVEQEGSQGADQARQEDPQVRTDNTGVRQSDEGAGEAGLQGNPDPAWQGRGHPGSQEGV